ncbi:MAG: LysM peptidoglycan-binding domain-containing protein [Halobacteriovoraceae bacterium]|nr:LysM peptidoglycan-binding domain-containing protein [Halobacteriovoraceae bacterium]
MKSVKLLLLIMAQLAFSSCSSKTSKPSNSGEFSSEFAVDEDNPLTEDEEGVTAFDDDFFDSIEDDIQEDAQVASSNIFEETETTETYNEGSFETYTVLEGETLMWIAFKLYGDYRDWRKLKRWNENILDYQDLPEIGAKLKYQPQQTASNWRAQGNPYLVLRGDTLFKVSKKVYEGQGHLWKSIWANNQVQIRDPNLIFAGFTLFYLPYEEVKRDIASEI